MIKRMTKGQLSNLRPDCEAAVKLLALVQAYGLDSPFVQFWEDENGMAASLIDCVLTLLPPAGEIGETGLFISMQPEILSLRTSSKAAEELAELLPGWRLETGKVMEPGRAMKSSNAVSHPLPEAVYSVLEACFPGNIPSFDVWYADVHHRWRHGLCRLVSVVEDNQTVACAMTTAECTGAAVIGAVATLPAYRGKGYASACVSTLAASLQEEKRRIYLSPKNDNAERLYSGLGFRVCGEWGTLGRPLHSQDG